MQKLHRADDSWDGIVLLGCAGAVLTCGKDNAVKVTDARSFQVQPAMSAPGFAVGGVWSKACLGPDERHCAAGSSTGSLFIWAVSPANLLRIVVACAHKSACTAVLCTPWRAWGPEGCMPFPGVEMEAHHPLLLSHE